MTKGEELVVGVELGGTKCIAVVAEGSTIIERRRWPTVDPSECLSEIVSAIDDWRVRYPIAAVGIASFGPLDLDARSSTFGQILNTPKPNWSNVDVLAALSAGFDGPIGLDTDVSGSALAEGRWGASHGCHTHVYLTIGTGVGAGVVVNDASLHGLSHPEAGHIRVRRDAADSFAGICPFHGDCLEGLVSGPAIAARAGQAIEGLAADDPVWAHVAGELAELIAILLLTVAPQRIVVGGGVIDGQPTLLPAIGGRLATLAGNYPNAEIARRISNLVVRPSLGADAGPLGAVALGLGALAAK